MSHTKLYILSHAGNFTFLFFENFFLKYMIPLCQIW